MTSPKSQTIITYLKYRAWYTSSLITKKKHNLNTLKIFIPSGNEKDKNKTSDAIELYLLKKTKQKTAIIYVANNYFQLDMERSLFIRWGERFRAEVNCFNQLKVPLMAVWVTVPTLKFMN